MVPQIIYTNTAAFCLSVSDITTTFMVLFSSGLKRNRWKKKLPCKEEHPEPLTTETRSSSFLTVSSSSPCQYKSHSHVSPLPYSGMLLWERTCRADNSGAQRNTEDERRIHWSAVHSLIRTDVLHRLLKTLDYKRVDSTIPQWQPRVPVLLKH